MTRKRLGKICRRAAVSPVMVKPRRHRASENIQQYQSIASKTQHGTALA
jgi:hypothetical protein